MIWLILLACATSSPSDDDDGGGDGGLSDMGDAGDSGGSSPSQVELTTSLGAFTIELDPDVAPVTVENFLAYVDSGFFDGDDGGGATIVHRVIADFVIQGGGYTENGVLKPPEDPIVNEATADRSNLQYTVAMARTDDPDSATSQWFVNLVDNTFLDPGESTDAGYAVFGEVVSGTDVVDAIGLVDTNSSDKPEDNVVIEDCERVD